MCIVWYFKEATTFLFDFTSGCDDLLPILSFVIIRSGMAQLVSECDAMEEFIPEGYVAFVAPSFSVGDLIPEGKQP